MNITSDHLTIIGWFVVPLVTVIVTYYQQTHSRNTINQEAQRRDLEAQRREKEKEIIDIIDYLNRNAIDFWFLSGDKSRSKKLSIIILGQLKRLEPLIPENTRPDLTDLRQTITGGEFNDIRRKALENNDRKFYEIQMHTENLKNKIKTSVSAKL